jgi:hypothetical protein
MWFKNLHLYRLPRNWAARRQQLAEQLGSTDPAGDATPPIRAASAGSRHATAVRTRTFAVNQQWLLALGVEEKLLPASIVKRFASDKAEEIEEAEGRRIGRREMREIQAGDDGRAAAARLHPQPQHLWLDRPDQRLAGHRLRLASKSRGVSRASAQIARCLAGQGAQSHAIAVGGDDRLGGRRRSTRRLHPRPGSRTALERQGQRALCQSHARRGRDPPAYRRRKRSSPVWR